MHHGGAGKRGYKLVRKEIELSSVKGTSGTEEPVQIRALTFSELFRVLLPYFWPDKGSDGAIINRIRSSTTWLMVILSKACNIVAPIYISAATDQLMNGRFGLAMQSTFTYCALRFASSLFKELQSIVYIKVKQQAGIQLQELVFTHLHSLSLNWHLSKRTGSVIKSMDRGVEAANSLVSYLFLFLFPAIAECLAVVILFFVQFSQWELGLTVLVGVSAYAIATVVITQWRKKFREQTNKHDNDFHDKATDSLINYETVKYFTNEAFEIERFTKAVASFQQQVSATLLSLGLLNVTQQLLLNATIAGTMLLAGRAVVRGEMTLGGWVAVQSWVASVFAPLNWLGSIYSAIFQAFIDIRNLSELLAESPDVVDRQGAVALVTTQLRAPSSPLHVAPSAFKGLSVEFRNVCFHYPGQSEARGLKNLSFTVAPGTTTAIVGHSGCGKTTISRLLFRFYDPLSGSVLINGQDISSCTQASVRKAVGIVPQDTVLFNDTLRHNVSYGRLGAEQLEITAAAEAAQVRAFIESLPEGWDTVVGERGLKLSGGEKQRVAIARCLLKNPPIVVFDEATSALDTVTEHSVQEALRALGENRTVLVIAHRLSTIRSADQILVLEQGEIVERGRHDELISRGGVYAELWSMQLSEVPPQSPLARP